MGVAGLLAFLCAPAMAIQDPEPGHSAYGHAFDEGPRTRPSKLDGIGYSHFPITTSDPEVQEWFDQGHTLLHSYEYWEAERAFRWCLKLDPDCATAWWGLARSVGPYSERFEPIIREAVRRKDKVSEREQEYIDAWARAYEPDLAGAYELRDSKRNRTALLVDELEQIVLAYPDDIEAKALLVNHGMRESRRIANEALLREIERIAPEHPGLHHYRIHVWDGKDGELALESCRIYGKLAGSLGHPNHMPGHVYSSMGLWHEAALWMESATRVELAAMNARQVFPFQYWNFPHNRNYLSYIMEQLGRPEDALVGARTLLATPRDPDENDATEGGRGPYHQGKRALLRCLTRFERWDELLEAEGVVWGDEPLEKSERAYYEARAYMGQGRLADAVEKVSELGKLLDEAEKNRKAFERRYDEARAFLRLAQGEDLSGLAEMMRIAEEQERNFYDDPPGDPGVIFVSLGEALLECGAPRLATEAFERALEIVRNDGFALSGLARAHHAMGEIEAAREAAGRLFHVWSEADPSLRWLAEVRALELDAPPIAAEAGTQRVYGKVDLSPLGPLEWEPYPAPELDVRDPNEEPITLAEFRGQNVLLVFYLGEQCPHCVEQLEELGKSAEAFGKRDTVLLGVSSDSPDKNRAATESAPHAFQLLSDQQHESARRFQAWDDFEEIELHATILIDRLGRVRWARVGGEPFSDVEFLLAELDRWKDAEL